MQAARFYLHLVTSSGVAVLGCDSSSVKIGDSTPSRDAGGSGGDGNRSGLIRNGPSEPERQAYCAGQGAAIAVPAQGGASACAGQLAETTFRYGVCVCDELRIHGNLRSDSLDSATSTTVVNGGAAVGANLRARVFGEWRIGGSLIAGGVFEGSTNVDVDVRGDMKAARWAATQGNFRVQRDLWVAGTFGPVSTITGAIERDVYTPSTPPAGVTIKGRVHQQAVTVRRIDIRVVGRTPKPGLRAASKSLPLHAGGARRQLRT